MTYIAAADLRERTRKPWAVGLVLGVEEASDADLDSVIALVATRIELATGDRFDPPVPDNDEALDCAGSGTTRLYVPRRVRSITTLKTRDTAGTLTTQASGSYRLHSSLNAAGTAMADGAHLDWLDVLLPLTVGSVWPSGAATVQITGKFGWAAVPDDIKRLTALLVYDAVKARDDPLSRISSRTTIDAAYTYGEPREVLDILQRYSRPTVLVG